MGSIFGLAVILFENKYFSVVIFLAALAGLWYYLHHFTKGTRSKSDMSIGKPLMLFWLLAVVISGVVVLMQMSGMELAV